jgi:hypothetical protein
MCSLLIAAGLIFPALASDNVISDTNWQNHPEIKAVRAIYNEIENAIKKHAYQEKEKYPPDSEELPNFSFKSIYFDGRGRARKYYVQGGTDDQALQFSYYYDKTGRLRFVYITGGAVNGTRMSHRIYFNAGGVRIFEKHEMSEPGYLWYEEWPEEALIKEPVAEFNKDE